MNDFYFFPPTVKSWLSFLLMPVLVATKLMAADPVATLTCPDDVYVTAGFDECSAMVDLESLPWSASMPVFSHNFTPGPDYEFGIGSTTVALAVHYTSGEMDTCYFDVIVAPVTANPTCQNDVFIYIEEDCEEIVMHNMVLTGLYACEDIYNVEITGLSGEDLGNTVGIDNIGENLLYIVEDDISGAACSGNLIVLGDHLPHDITCPPDITVTCHGSPDPEFTGYAVAATCLEENLIDYSMVDDIDNTPCDGDDISYVINRTWTATDPYDNMASCTQLITGIRLQLSDVVFPPDYDGIDQPALSCSNTESFEIIADTSNTGIPTILGIDPTTVACEITFEISDSVELVCGSHFEIMREWKVIDYCLDDTVTHIQYISIPDETGPVFTIPDTIYVSTNGECGTLATLPSIGQVDECSSFIVRIETPWETINSNGGLADIPQQEGIFTVTYTAIDACDNETVQTAVLNVTSGFIVTCPEPAAITCDFYNNELQAALDTGNLQVLSPFGFPQFYANCDLTLTQHLTFNFDACGEGFFTRTFGSAEIPGECSQVIEVNNVSDFVVSFPADTSFTCGNVPADFGQPVLSGDNCEQLTSSYNDIVFTNVQNACFRVERTWVVTNSCVTGAVEDQEVTEVPESQLGLPYPDCDLDGDGDCDDHTFRDSWTATTMPGASQATQQTGPDTDPDSDPWDGYITYTQEIEVIDSFPPVFTNGCEPDIACITGPNCVTGLVIPQPQADDCYPSLNYEAEVFFSGVWNPGFGPFPGLIPGDYPVRYTATDLCGNATICETFITVQDCQPPTAGCDGLFGEFEIPANPGDDAVVQFFAYEFNDNSFDNCDNSVSFSFSSDISDNVITFTCDDGPGQHTVDLWVTDNAGNQTTCTTFVILDDPSQVCDGSPFISGNISTEEGEGVNDVEIQLSTGGAVMTDLSGDFAFAANAGGNVTLTPFKNTNFLNGVSTFDAVLISKHILAIEALNSPYKIIAADVNHSNAVTTLDLVEIRRLVLAINNEFPNNTSWRFVPADFVFPDPANPYASAFPEVVTSQAMSGEYDFIGIKVGDVNGSADPGLFTNSASDRTYGDAIVFPMPDGMLEKGAVIDLPFYTPDEYLFGFQSALRFDPGKLELLGIIPGIADENSFGKRQLEEGLLRMSWYNPVPVSSSETSPFFLLRFRVKVPIDLRSTISLDPVVLSPEAYGESTDISSLQLEFQQEETARQTRFYPNRPNPFNSSAIMPLYLPEDGTVQFSFYNASGMLLLQKDVALTAGYNELEINANELPAKGVIFYRVKTATGTSEGKMMIE